MAVKVAEYLGLRAEVSGTTIAPAIGTPACPFTNSEPCKKIANDKKPPVCSVRKTARGVDGMLWITCSKRLCASQHGISLSAYQSDMLYAIAKILFGAGINKDDVLIKSEEKIAFHAPEVKPYRADFTMQLRERKQSTMRGKNRFIVEMQGGGETSNTGKLTAQIADWKGKTARTNADLIVPVKDVGTLETNAWRRQQEQLLVKGSAAKDTGECGMALCVGRALFDYIIRKIGEDRLRSFRKDPQTSAWTLAIIPIVETTANDAEGIRAGDSIVLEPDKDQTLYMDYDHFVNLLVAQGGDSSDAFKGKCLDLNGVQVDIP